MRSFVWIALAGIAAASLSRSALAEEASAFADLKQLHIELIDLDPLDGISPTISFHDKEPVFLFGQVDLLGAPSSFIIKRAAAGAALMDSAVSTPPAPASSLHLALSAGDVLGDAGPTLSAIGRSEAGASFFGGAYFQSVFTLSPQTRIVLSGQPGELQAYEPVGANRSAFALSLVAFCPLTADGLQRCSDEETLADLSDSQFAIESRGPGRNYSERPSHLSVSWDNSTTSAKGHSLYAQVFVLNGAAAPVPEPNAAWLMLAGLALGAPAISRRLRSNASV